MIRFRLPGFVLLAAFGVQSCSDIQRDHNLPLSQSDALAVRTLVSGFDLPKGSRDVYEDTGGFQSTRQHLRFTAPEAQARMFSTAIIGGDISSGNVPKQIVIRNLNETQLPKKPYDWWIEKIEPHDEGGELQDVYTNSVQVVMRTRGDEATVWSYIVRQ